MALSNEVQSVLAQWAISLPPSLEETLATLGPDEEVGVWKLDPSLADPSILDAGAPINLFPIGSDGMGDYLCLYWPKFDEPSAEDVPIVVWSPAERQVTSVGDNFRDFLKKEMHRRLDFLLERAEPLTSDEAQAALADNEVDFPSREGDEKLIAQMMADVCRTSARLRLDDAISRHAQSREATPPFLRQVDGHDESAIDAAVDELRLAAEKGNGSAAYEVVGFMQIKQRHEDVARWAYQMAKCSLFTWPGLSASTVAKVAEAIKAQSAAIPAKDRLDPLFSFITTQVATKVDGRLQLAKQYLRKKDNASAVREAENALRLAPTSGSDEAVVKNLRASYEMLRDIFQSAGRSREQRYAELMIEKIPSAG